MHTRPLSDRKAIFWFEIL